jgi:chromosome segregation ATPase
MGMFDGITGKDLSNKIDEFVRICGETLIGMHQQLETQQKALKAQVEQGERHLSSLSHDVDIRAKAALEEVNERLTQVRDLRSMLVRLNQGVEEARREVDQVVQQADQKFVDLDRRGDEIVRRTNEQLNVERENFIARLAESLKRFQANLDAERQEHRHLITETLVEFRTRTFNLVRASAAVALACLLAAIGVWIWKS